MATVIAHGGYREATVDRVLAQAHVGWEEFNRQFADLDACFLSAVDAGFECAATEVSRASAHQARHDGADAALSTALDRLIEVLVANPEVANLCLVESAGLGVRAIECKERGLQRFVELLEGQLSAGGQHGSASSLAAEMVAGGIYEVLQRKVRTGTLDEKRGELAAELRQVWVPVVRASARSGSPD